MAKWNPFEKHILRADPDEFSSGDADYGTVRDADKAPDMNSEDTAASQNPYGEGTVLSPGASADNTGDNRVPSPDNTGEVLEQPADNGGEARMQPSDNGSEVRPQPYDNVSEARPQPADNGSAAGEQPSDNGSENRTQPSDNSGGARTPSAGSADDPQAPAEAIWPEQSASANGSPMSEERSTAGTPDMGAAGSSNRAAHFSSGHDFDDDEPKFDTQTGERLDKPKKKLPAMILTVVVSILAVCAFIISLRLGGSVSEKKAEEKEPAETEAHLAIAQPSSETGKESEKAAGTQPVQTEAESVLTIRANHETDTAAQTQSEDNASEAQSEDTAAQTQSEEPVASVGGKGLQSEETAESETAVETETETEAEKSGGVPQFKTEGVTVSTSIDVADLVEEVMPGIVSVTSTNVQTVRDFFYGLKEIRKTDAGSGTIVDRDDSYLYIVTDGSILSGAQDVTVGFCVKKELTKELSDDDTVASAEVVGIDDDSMLAVIRVKLDKINKTVLPMIKTAELGDSDRLRVGQRVIAIGNAMGHGLSVTQGIVSAVNRQMRYGSSVHSFIQTDASINYGNYGGALLNEAGEVIGINAGKITENSSEGMGFAFPVNDVREAAARMLPDRNGKMSEPEAGSAAETEQAKTSESGGEKDVLTLALAQDESGESSPGAEPDDGKNETEHAGAQESDIKETEKPDAEDAGTQKPETENAGIQKSGTEDQSEASSSQGQLGVQVGEFSKEDQIIYRIPAGAVIAEVTAGSGAQQAGLASGDLITAVNEEEITSVNELKTALSGLKSGDRVKVSFIRPDDDNAYRKDNVMSVMVTLQ